MSGSPATMNNSPPRLFPFLRESLFAETNKGIMVYYGDSW